jgi:hypothetical protein
LKLLIDNKISIDNFEYHLIKSDLILRDIGLLKKIYKSAILPENLDSAQRMGAIITFSFSTMDWKWPEYLNLLLRLP